MSLTLRSNRLLMFYTVSVLNNNRRSYSIISCIMQITILKVLWNVNIMSVKWINTCSLSKNFDDFQLFIQSANIDSDVILGSRKLWLVDINLPNYSYVSYLTESSAGSTLHYGRNYLLYKIRKDLSICKSYEPESTSIDINNCKKENIAIRCIYKHP